MNEVIFRAINNLAGSHNILDQLMIFFSDRLGYLLVIILGLLALRNFKKYADMAVVALGSAIVARFGVTGIIRMFYDHPRPYLVLSNVHLADFRELEPSFPSGHASFYFALAIAVYLYNKTLGYWFLAAAILMGIARIYIGVHWPFDILAGAAVGFVVALLAYKVYPKFKNLIK
ncbi:phosphatase PAP2 family protein [Candidatus Parcubacteria bacterium]|nr:phosphatase PAP2 family protein [Candidatus Parcubacteria bacterium]